MQDGMSSVVNSSDVNLEPFAKSAGVPVFRHELPTLVIRSCLSIISSIQLIVLKQSRNDPNSSSIPLSHSLSILLDRDEEFLIPR